MSEEKKQRLKGNKKKIKKNYLEAKKSQSKMYQSNN